MIESVFFRAIHIVAVIVWLGTIPADFLLRKLIRENKRTESEKTLLSLWLKLSNLGGMIGLTGILVSGIFMSITLGYGFFNFSSGANHWLYTKQFIIVIVVVLIGALVIPTAKKIRLDLEKNVTSTSALSDDTYKNISKLKKALTITNVLIVLNLLLALSRNLL